MKTKFLNFALSEDKKKKRKKRELRAQYGIQQKVKVRKYT